MTQSYITAVYSNALSNQNITSALLVGTYTEPGTRARKVYCSIYADQIAGNGNYIVYATQQIAGAGSAYEMERHTVAVPSGVTAYKFPSIALMCNVGDVIKGYLIGLAGDTTTPDILMNVWEEFVGVGADGNALISTDAQDRSTTFSVNTKYWAGGAIPAPAVTGVPKVDLFYILGALLTGTAAQIVAAVTKFFNVAAPTGTVNSIPDAVAGAAGGLAIVGSVMGKSPATLAAADVSGNLPADVKAYTVQPTLNQADVRTALGMALANLDTQLAAIAGYIDTEVALIKAKTDNLPADTATVLGTLATAAKLLAYVKSLARKDLAADADIGGAYDPATDSQEAIRDRGDTAWTTGGAALTAQDVRDAMKLAPSAGAPAATSIDDKLNTLVPGAPIDLTVEQTEIHVN